MALPDHPPVRLADPLRSRAVLVGPRAYQHLKPLPAVARNLTGLQALLTDLELWGLPSRHCTVLDSPESTDVVLNALMRAASAATDTLLFYFAGHGLIDPDSGRLWLALAEAGIGPVHDAIAYEDVRRHISHSACISKLCV
jgi:caspase domain-containing protein